MIEKGQQTEPKIGSMMVLGTKNDMAERTISIANLSRRITERVLENFCRTKGRILGVSIKKNVVGSVFAFVRFEEDVDIDVVISKMNGIWIMDRKIVVERAKADLKVRVFTNNPKELTFDGNCATMKKKTEIQVLELFANKDFVADNEWAVKLISTEFKQLKEVHELCFSLDICFKLLSRKGRYCIVVVLNDEFSVKKLLDNHERFKHDFVKVERMGAFSVYSRINWFEIHGLANECWTEENFIKIAEKWGSWIFTAEPTATRKRWDKAFILVEVNQLNVIDEVMEIMHDHRVKKIKVCENDVEDEQCIKEDFVFWKEYEEEIHSPSLAASVETPRISSPFNHNLSHIITDRGIVAEGLGVSNVVVTSDDELIEKINSVVQETPLNNVLSEEHFELQNLEEGNQKLHLHQETRVNATSEPDHGNDCLCIPCEGFSRKTLLQQKQRTKANEKVKGVSMKAKDNIFSFKKRGRPPGNKNSQSTSNSSSRNGKEWEKWQGNKITRYNSCQRV